MTARQDTENGARRGLGRWLGIALVASLCVNLLIAGALASSYWSIRKSGDGIGAGARRGGDQFGRFVSSLPAERRQAIREAAAGGRRALSPLRQQARMAREDVNRLLAAETLDRKGLAAAHLREIEAEAEIRRAVSRVLMDVAAMMTAEERRAFAQWREQRPGGRGRRGAGRADDARP